MIHVETVHSSSHPPQAQDGDIVIAIRCSHLPRPSLTIWPALHILVQLARSTDVAHSEAGFKHLCHESLVKVSSVGQFVACGCADRYWMKHGLVLVSTRPTDQREIMIHPIIWN